MFVDTDYYNATLHLYKYMSQNKNIESSSTPTLTSVPYQAATAPNTTAIKALPALKLLASAPFFGALVADVLAEDELDPVGLALVLGVSLDELLLVIVVEPVELELPVVLVNIVDMVDELLPEVVEEADVVLLPEVDEELSVLLALALLELVMEATVLVDSITNCGV